jgi:Flavin containing amine oxidoreductase
VEATSNFQLEKVKRPPWNSDLGGFLVDMLLSSSSSFRSFLRGRLLAAVEFKVYIALDKPIVLTHKGTRKAMTTFRTSAVVVAFSFFLGAVLDIASSNAFVAPPSSRSTTSVRRFSLSTSTLAAISADKQQQGVDCLVIGGGISGSTLAHNLNQAGVQVCLAEARDYLGGNVKSHKTVDGFIWEEGPNSFATQPSIVRIAYELGIHDQLVFADESLPPWVNHNGKLHPLPKGQGGKGAAGQVELVFGPNGVLKFALLELAGQDSCWDWSLYRTRRSSK